MNPKVKAAIASIDHDAWTPIKYPRAVYDELAGRWVSDAQIAALTATGGLLLVGVALRLLRIREIPVADLLPALLVAPALVQFAAAIQ